MSHSTSSIRTPIAKARNHGSAKSGTEHFWHQRITAFANIFIVIIFMSFALCVIGKSYAEVQALIANPVVAGTLILSILNVCYHMKLGLQVIIEDYIHTAGLKVFLLIANIFFSLKIALFSTIAILMIAL